MDGQADRQMEPLASASASVPQWAWREGRPGEPEALGGGTGAGTGAS